MTVETDEAIDRVDRWLRIDADGVVWILTGKVELGQGIHRALRIIVADALDLPLERVRIAPVDTDRSPDEGLTAGSRSIEESGRHLRAVAATAVEALRAAAATRLGVPVEAVIVRGGILRADDGRTLGLEAFAGDTGVLARPVDPAAAGIASGRQPDAAAPGGSRSRIDLEVLVTGAPAYLQDLRLPGMLHARVIRPPSYDARLVDVDRAAIEGLPGVVDLIRDGDFLALIAEREEQAVLALGRSKRYVTWREGPDLPPVDDPRYLVEMPSEEIVVRDWPAPIERATPTAAPVDGLRTVEAAYSRQHLAHGALAPSCAVAVVEDGRLHVWTHSQGIFRVRHELAVVLGMEESSIRVEHRPGAGCYGHNGADDVALDAALLAVRRPGSPIRVQWMRDDEFAWEPYGPAMLIRLAADVDASGRIVAWRHRSWSHGHEARPWMTGRDDQSALLAARHLAEPFGVRGARRPQTGSSGALRNSMPIYDLPAGSIVDHFVPEAPLRVSSLRALGAHPNVFAIESMMDEAARAIGEDPVTFRLRHLSDPRAIAVIERVVAAAARTPVATGDDRPRGRGLGFARYKSKAAYAAVIVEVALDTEIRVTHAWAAIDAGLVIDPDGLANQTEGGIIQATSWTLHEAIRTDGAAIATRTWDTYRTLRFPEAPVVEVELIDRPDEPPVGAGEAVAGPTSAAIANAVADASGIRLRDLPLTRERFIAAVG